MAGHYQETVEDQVSGRPVNGAVIYVYEDGATISDDGKSVTSGTFATIFSDDGITEINQSSAPLTTAADGEFDFYTNENRVVVAVTVNGVGKAVWNDQDIIGGTVSSDVTALATRVDALEAFDDTLGTIATQDADDVAITGGSIAGITDLAVADGGTGASSASAARTNLGAAASSQTEEQISGYIATPADKDYKLIVKMAHAGTITETTTISASGTCTATFKVNTTALGGTANSVSSSEQSQAHASSNTFAAGDDIVLTVSANSTCVDLSFTIKYTRTFA